MRKLVVFLMMIIATNMVAQESLFANYFDIETNQKSGSKVFGKINLKSNKDAHVKKIPEKYQFHIDKKDTDIFTIVTERDEVGRVFGVIKVAKRKNTGKNVADYKLKVSLRNKKEILAQQDIVIHVVKKTMWQELVDVFTPKTTTISRLYGRKTFSDNKLENILQDLEKNDGRFSNLDIYDKVPSYYKGKGKKALDKAWEDAVSSIGALGYAYAKSKTYGVHSGNLDNANRLKRAIYKSVLAYTTIVPVYGNELLENGKPVGTEIGDGFSNNPYLTHGMVTHQWKVTDGLVAPLVQVWPELLEDMEEGDEEALSVYNEVIRYYQLFFSIVEKRRRMNDVNQRWKDISDLNYSEGAWSDANIAHRMRTLMAMPILWADYNRPITYVPYWYDDYYNGTEFEGKTFAKNWSPSGVVTDVRSWCDKLSLPSHVFNQSGFHPDGTVTHHSGHHASDVAMYAYGFEWLTTVNSAIEYFKNTPYPIKDESYQFLADRLDYTYRRLIYKNSLDYTVSGRSFYIDMSHFGTTHVVESIDQMLKGKSSTTVINGENSVKELKTALKKGTHTHTETTSFWNGDYLMHRKEDKETNYYYSVKHKSVRTSGAEDFDKIRKSWHAGSGVFLLRVDGDEYNRKVKEQSDWHVLPGVTEAWEKDPMPVGAASLAMPGANEFSGVLSNGSLGLAGYHHKPADTYSSAEALKSTHFIGNYGIALGSTIKRKANSKKTAPIVTCVDQSALDSKLTYYANGKKEVIKPGSSENIEITSSKPIWLHHGKKGYLIFPKNKQKVFIKTGTEINVTDTSIKNNKSANYIIAINHGEKPKAVESGYHYVLLADVSEEVMEDQLKLYLKNHELSLKPDASHAIYLKEQGVKQVMFFKKGTVVLDKYEISSDQPSLLMLADKGSQLEISVLDPLHSLKTTELTITVPEKLKEGTYRYSFQGIKPMLAEYATVVNQGEKSFVKIQLPDTRDSELYNYREEMYAGAPIVLKIDKIK